MAKYLQLPSLPTTGADALAKAISTGIDRLEAQRLLLYAHGRPISDRAWLLAHDGDPLAVGIAQHFGALCERRLLGEPLAYIVGYQEFFGLLLQIDNRVLVPRPDTETLVEWALSTLAIPATPGLPQQAAVLDLGTGSGAIALAIAHRQLAAGRPVQVTAVDASADALALARSNAQRLGLSVDFQQDCWMDGLHQQFDLIVSNPPYIASGDPHLAALRHEPLEALASGNDGLDDIRHIVRTAPHHLLPGGWLLLEHGYNQSAQVHGLLDAQGFGQVQSRHDLAGIARCTGGQWLPPTAPAGHGLPHGQR